MTTITIELCPEDRARLDKIIEELAASRPTCSTCVQEISAIARDFGRTDLIDQEDPTPWETTQEEKPEAPAAPSVTRTDIQRLVISLASAGKKAETREIVQAYAEKVSMIPEDKLAEVYDRLQALEG